jgi:hypothetical protein
VIRIRERIFYTPICLLQKHRSYKCLCICLFLNYL